MGILYKKIIISLWITITLIVFLLLLHGCASIQKKGKDPKESLKVIAEQYWSMRMEDKYEETYKLEDKEKLLPFETYRAKARAMKRIDIRSSKIKDININGNNGMVDVEFSFVLPNVPKPLQQVIKDQWVYKDGKWWHILPDR
ncbi:MAG: hypothetical protein AB1480_00035 [Nitrospirota bacterium]